MSVWKSAESGPLGCQALASSFREIYRPEMAARPVAGHLGGQINMQPLPGYRPSQLESAPPLIDLSLAVGPKTDTGRPGALDRGRPFGSLDLRRNNKFSSADSDGAFSLDRPIK